MALLNTLTNQAHYLVPGVFFLLVISILWLSRSSSLKGIRGPPRSSFWLGNQGDFKYQEEVGDVEFQWLKEFGGAWKLYGPLGEEQLVLADPKALQYVLQTRAYDFAKRADTRANSRMLLGDGIIWAHGERHQRHRKIMNPAFTVPQLKSFVPLFLRHVDKLVQKMKEVEIGTTGSESIVNMYPWLSRTTLDVIGDAGFGFQFGSLDSTANELSGVYDNLFVDSTLYPHGWDIVFRSLWKYLPESVLYWLRYLPSREYQRFRRYQDFMRVFGRKLISRTLASGKEAAGKDVMSVLLRANEAENPKLKLSESEVVDQISTILLAGHDTTASSLTWYFYELARHKDWQDRVRDEIRATRRKLAERGDDEFTISDLEGMSAMHATLREAMRLHPIVWLLSRVASQDDVIPLSKPIISESGQQISAIPVRKGQNVEISIATYNRNPDVWGADAGEWNPDRFLRLDKAGMTSVGVFANLLNFSAGIRACIGWRFSTLEMQAIAATLIENFEFSLPPQTDENIIKRRPTGVMVPMTDGHSGIWMGLKVKPCT